MKILDTKKAKERYEAEKELREFEEWLKDGVNNMVPPSYDDLKWLFDGYRPIVEEAM